MTTAEFNFAALVESVAAARPDRIAVIQDGNRLTYQRFAERSRRLARLLLDHRLGCFAERSTLRGHQLGQHRMAQYLYNGPEYLEGMIGAYRARVAPFNVNYRYVADELHYLLTNSGASAIQYHARFAPVLAEVLRRGEGRPPLLLQVDDNSGEPLLPGALDYEQALAATRPDLDVTPDPDDVYLLYTGGTTGLPKGVIWRQADIAVTAVGLYNTREHREWESTDELFSRSGGAAARFLTCAPLIHGAAQWGALRTLAEGHTVVFPADPTVFDAAALWDTVAAEAVTQMSIVGDVFARALVEEIERHPRDVSALRYLISGGAALQPAFKRRLLAAVPGLSVVETIGSSETGIQGRSSASDAASADRRSFQRDSRTEVVSEDRGRFLEPGHPGTGWLASRGRVPLGYLGDEAKTATSFPVIGGVRVSLPGDRARLLADGTVELLGRDSVTINSGGEKIFAEEVEAALKHHPDVLDAVVCGRPSERWGAEVVAIVVTRPGQPVDQVALRSTCAQRLARYKLPKQIIVVDRIERSPAGKADYRWAAATAREAAGSADGSELDR
jgi:fatty-acyl-CoA synthase